VYISWINKKVFQYCWCTVQTWRLLHSDIYYYKRCVLLVLFEYFNDARSHERKSEEHMLILIYLANICKWNLGCLHHIISFVINLGRRCRNQMIVMWHNSQGDNFPVLYANWSVFISVKHNLATRSLSSS